MNKYFKILKIEDTELSHQSGNFPVQGIIPFGPPFDSKEGAKDWLKKNSEKGMEYFFQRLYSREVPQGLQIAEKKPKQEQESADQ